MPLSDPPKNSVPKIKAPTPRVISSKSKSKKKISPKILFPPYAIDPGICVTIGIPPGWGWMTTECPGAC